jgi:hypothetical protein
MPRIPLLCTLALAGLAYSSGTGQAQQKPTAEGIAFFETKIRPVLAEHCYTCHSQPAAKSKKLKGGLLLDSREGMHQGGNNGPVLVPGDAKKSLLLAMLRHDPAVGKMPPTGKLPDAIIADFAKWIDMGAPDPREGKAASGKKVYDIAKERGYWAFRPLGAAPPPAVKNGAWVRTPIDRFILARLEEKGLAPNGPAAAERLLRRAHFDATGLPPTPAEVAAFVQEFAGGEAAYDRLVDRLLDSPRFGERWARHWLDTVRFAESGGYEFDGNRPSAYHYRDFVIKALNSDMPFDQFIRWQLAGDHLVPGDYQAIAATGFLVAGSYPGQTTAKTLALIRYDHLDDMISTLGTSVLGLSLGCARCHEHKYDPIPQEDYYRLIAALGRTDSANLKVNLDPAGYQKLKAAFDAAHAPFLKARDDFEKNALAKFVQAFWTANQQHAAPTWLVLDPVEAKGMGKRQKNETHTYIAQTVQKKIRSLRLEALADGSLPKSGPGEGSDGSFVLSEINVTAAPVDAALKAKTKAINVKLKAGRATADDAKFPLAAAVDNNPKTGWSAAAGKDQAATFDFEGDIGFDGGTVLTVTLKFENNHHAIGKARLAITTATGAALDAPAESQAVTELVTSLRSSQGMWTPGHRDAVSPWVRKLNADAERVYGAVERHAREDPKPNLIDVFAAQSGRGGPVNFLVRGEPEKKREVVEPGFAQVLTTVPARDEKWLGDKKAPVEPRVALARWLTDTNDGAGNLVARVIVNRLWQHHFGKGLVATPNDFGVQGESPTHPELLDYLAQELIRNGWRLKPIHTLIMTSAVYRQSNATNAAGVKLDPANKLWWRHPTRRLEAEAIRDSLLAVAGTLDLQMYGPGTLDGNSPRRSVYLTVKRSQMIPFLQMFDVPEALQSIGERSVTTVPTQSLAFMNSPLVRGAAQKLAARVRSQSDAEVIEQAYLIALSRRPTDAERQRMESFIGRQATGAGPAQAHEQAVIDFCQVLLCLNEFIYVD